MDFTTHPFYTEESSVMYVLPSAKDRCDIFIKPFKNEVSFYVASVQAYPFSLITRKELRIADGNGFLDPP